METDKSKHLEQTAEIVAAYLANHSASPETLPELIRTVHSTISQLGRPETAPKMEAAGPSAAEIRKSITVDHLISFEDGKRYKTLRRHLNKHGLTPDAYRAKWGLPSTYPMVAPSHAASRSAIAKKIGFGVKAPDPESQPEPPPTVEAAPRVEVIPEPVATPAKRKILGLFSRRAAAN